MGFRRHKRGTCGAVGRRDSRCKPLRILAAIAALLIVVSTVTTGWHYISDVAGGIALAAFSLAAAKRLICLVNDFGAA